MFKKMLLLMTVVCALIFAPAVFGFNPNSDESLVGLWKLDEGSGSIAADSSGNSNDGTLQGDPQWATGMLGGALAFDGDGDYVDCGNSEVFDLTEQVTLAVWVNANDLNDSRHHPWLGKGNTAYSLKHNSGNRFEFYVYGGGWHCVFSYYDDSFSGQWHHLAGTFDGSELIIYVDGEFAASSNYSGGIDTTTNSVTLAENSQSTGRVYAGINDDPPI